MTSSRPLRLGVLGAGGIARQFIAAVAASPLVEMAAVASRSGEKASAYAKETGLPRAFASYEAMLADPDIDAVYNALPNSLHARWSIAAAQAGKHVLCEKPLADSEEEAKAMFAAARENGVHLVEAYPYLAQPMTREVRRLVAEGAIGRVHLVRAAFGFPFSDPANIRLQSDLAGGATMDLGAYVASFIRVIAGERPTRVSALARWGATGVDATLVATLDFASGLIAQFSASFASGYHRHAQIAGEAGSIETMYLNHPPAGGPAVIQIRRGALISSPIETIPVAEGNGFLLEAESFARLVQTGEAARWTGATEAESLDTAAILAALRRSARTGEAVSL